MVDAVLVNTHMVGDELDDAMKIELKKKWNRYEMIGVLHTVGKWLISMGELQNNDETPIDVARKALNCEYADDEFAMLHLRTLFNYHYEEAEHGGCNVLFFYLSENGQLYMEAADHRIPNRLMTFRLDDKEPLLWSFDQEQQGKPIRELPNTIKFDNLRTTIRDMDNLRHWLRQNLADPAQLGEYYWIDRVIETVWAGYSSIELSKLESRSGVPCTYTFHVRYNQQGDECETEIFL